MAKKIQTVKIWPLPIQTLNETLLNLCCLRLLKVVIEQFNRVLMELKLSILPLSVSIFFSLLFFVWLNLNFSFYFFPGQCAESKSPDTGSNITVPTLVFLMTILTLLYGTRWWCHIHIKNSSSQENNVNKNYREVLV